MNACVRAPRFWTAALAWLLAGAASLPAQERAFWRPEDRAVLTAFHEIEALARDERRIYAATPRGLAIYDFVAARWELPSTEEDGYPVGQIPTATAFDPASRAVWLATADGALFSFQADLQRWDAWGPAATGPILRIVPASGLPAAWGESGLYVLTRAGWYRVARFGGPAEPVPAGRLPPELVRAAESVEARISGADPFFAAVRGTLALDAMLRRWPITDYVADDRPNRYWIATRGGHLLHYDSRFMRAEPRPFGLLTVGVQSLAADGAGGIWFGGDGRGTRRGVTWGSDRMQAWRYYEAGITGAPAGPVFDMVGSGAATWFAAPDGLHRLDLETQRWRRWTEADGLPSATAYALEPAPDGGVWVGTAAGPARVTADGTVAAVSLGARQPARALLLLRDTLWVGGDLGVFWLLADGVAYPATDGAGAAPPAPVLDLAVTAGAVWALASDALWRWDGQHWDGPQREVALEGLGRLARLRVDGPVVWVAGSGGIAHRDAGTGTWRIYRVGATIPRGPVTDVLPEREVVYAATPAGAVRIAWTRLP
ncbi:MAG: hypothetical protein HY704_17770 [Gemmatimonadetes bacterium]|nr:hypothetical protein [Gemmatimonadota bacterium]